MADLAKNPGGQAAWSNQIRRVEVEYDFAEDLGGIAILDVLTFDEKVVIEGYHLKVDTAVTSAGAPTIEVGIKGGDTDALMAATVKANLAIGVTVKQAATADKLVVASGAVIALETKVAVLTAGKFRMVILYSQF